MVPGSISTEAREIFQEGLRLPAVKLISEGRPIRSVLEIMKANSRLPDFLQGDMWAGIAAARVGERRILELARRYGARRSSPRSRSFMDHGEQVVARARSASCRRGVPRSTRSRTTARSIASRSRSAATSSSSTCARTRTRTRARTTSRATAAVIAAQMVLMNLTDPPASANAGHYRAAARAHPAGHGVRPAPPAAFAIYYEVRIRLYDLLWRCLAPHLGDRLPAGGFALDLRHVHRRAAPGHRPALHDRRAADRRLGRTATRDGNSAMFSAIHGDTFNCPVEVAEARYGLYVDRLALERRAEAARASTAAARASCSTTASARTAASSPARTRATGTRRGRSHGGRDGSPNCVEVIRRDGAVEEHAVVTLLEVNEGDVIRIHTGSGGGYGNPRRRPRQLVLDDVRNGYLTADLARARYGLEDR